MDLLTVKNLSFGYGGKEILHNIDFEAKHGEIISLIGSNGCGKSTLLRCLSGINKVPHHSIYINGEPIESCHIKKISQTLAFLPQFQENLVGTSVYDLVSMGRAPYHKSGWIMNKDDKSKIMWAMDYMSLSHYKNRCVDTLSGGERQRVWIAMILAQDTPVILLDEPVTYMDMKHQWNLLATMLDLKKNYGKTIVSVFHDINHAMEVSDKIYMMKSGTIYDKGVPDVVITKEAISQVYDVSAHVCRFRKCCRQIIVPAGCNKFKD